GRRAGARQLLLRSGRHARAAGALDAHAGRIHSHAGGLRRLPRRQRREGAVRSQGDPDLHAGARDARERAAERRRRGGAFRETRAGGSSDQVETDRQVGNVEVSMVGNRIVPFVVALFVGLLLLPVAASAQSSITGVVKDASGAVIPGVQVDASSPVLIEQTRSVVTDSQGVYRVVDLRPGT